MNPYFNELNHILTKLGENHRLDQVFRDLLTISMCYYSKANLVTGEQTMDKDDWHTYSRTIEKYKGEESNELVHCLFVLQLNGAEYPYSDILGEFYSQFLNKELDHSLCVTSRIYTKTTPEFMGIGSKVFDLECGSGRQLLNNAKRDRNSYFHGADMDFVCVQMTLLNLFFNNLMGEIAWMKSDAPDWFGAWQVGMNGLAIRYVEIEDSDLFSEVYL